MNAKTNTKLVLLSIAAALAGCSTMQPQTAYNDVDYQKVAIVERSAVLGNAKVVWINYPRKVPTAE